MASSKNTKTKKKVSKRGRVGEGRPSKLTPTFLEIAEEVILDDINAIIFTDEDLVDEINERLPEKDRITYQTLKNWKRNVKNNEKLDENGKQFFTLIKKALRVQINSLFKEMRKDKVGWQRFAWIIERKLDAWNIKYKHDHTTDGEPINFLIPQQVADKNGLTQGAGENSGEPEEV